MSKEAAVKLTAELQTNEGLKAKIEGVTDKNELVRIANEAGYDVTLDEMIEAEREYKAGVASKTDGVSDELSSEELESAAGGSVWMNDNGKDGHELFCIASYHGWDYSHQKNDYCTNQYHVDRVDVSCNSNVAKPGQNSIMCRYNYLDENGKRHGIGYVR